MYGLKPFGEMGNALDDFFNAGFGNIKVFDSQMKTDIKETDTSFIVECEIPGYNKSDISVDIEDGILRISAENVKENEELKENYVRKERFSGKISRSFRFENINEDGITAKYENGILIVEVPKAEKVAKKGIDIN